MNAHSVVEDWEVTPFEDGFGGLAELGSRGFDGAVEAADTWLFLRDGEPVAVISNLESSPRPGDIDAFEGASGQKYEAPSGAAATIAAMLALDGEVRGRYFTDDTPLSAVHDTLSGGGFTGYVELSENVLSGDYYYVYVDGEVDYVAFVGSSQRFYGDEAQTKAENEVGIYAVTAVSLPDLELPDPPSEPEPDPDPTPDTSSVSGTTADSGTDSDSPSSDSDSASISDVPTAPSDASAATDADATEPAADSGTEADSGADRGSDSPSTIDVGTEIGADSSSEPATSRTDEGRPRTETGDPERSDATADDDPDTVGASTDDRQTDTESRSDPYPSADEDTRSTDRTADSRPEASTSTESRPSDTQPTDDPSRNERSKEPPDETASSGIAGLATRAVPSLDPEQSRQAGSDASGTDRNQSAGRQPHSAGASRSAEPTTGTESTSETSGGRSREAFEAEIEQYEDRIEDLEADLSERETEIDDYERRIAELEADLEAVRNERDELEARLEALDTDDTAAGASLSPEEALAETSLFVRERTRGEATLQDGHGGTEDRETVISNLRIDYHTTFESTDATVESEPFDSWLRSSPPYEFAEWLVTELLFEIRSTGAQDGLRPLFDALPSIDRVGFGETVPIDSGTESEDAAPETKQFDIVARDKKGNPIVVAHFDQSRDPTHADTIGPFVTDSSDVCEANETLAAAVAVTSSYFEADAMRATEEATSSSLLSRSKHRSYVKLSRSNGYHLCLVEARDNTFNLTVPEL